jgi:predicted secreted protein
MAVYLSNTVVVTLNSVVLSDHVTSATINRVFDELEVTAMGDTAHKFVKGLEASTITLDFLSDTATANVNATLQAAWGTTVPITLKQTSAAVSPTNPLYSTTILVNNTTDINGAVADIATQSITFTCNSPVVVTTA